MIEYGFERCVVDPCLYKYVVGGSGSILICAVHVDDVLCGYNDANSMDDFEPRVEVRAQPTVLSPPRPLTFANAPGRRVLAPAAMWPRFLCGEHDGEGWEATVEKVRSGQGGRAEALVAFVARRTRGAGWKPMWLQLSSLRPLR